MVYSACQNKRLHFTIQMERTVKFSPTIPKNSISSFKRSELRSKHTNINYRDAEMSYIESYGVHSPRKDHGGSTYMKINRNQIIELRSWVESTLQLANLDSSVKGASIPRYYFHISGTMLPIFNF